MRLNSVNNKSNKYNYIKYDYIGDSKWVIDTFEFYKNQGNKKGFLDIIVFFW